MKCLQVFEPGVDGVFRHVEGLTRFLVNRGHRVGLAYSSKRGSVALTDLVADAKTRNDPVVDMRVGNSPCPGDVRALLMIAREVRRWRPDVIHAHSSKAGVLGRAVARLTGIPMFYTPNAYYGMGTKRAPAKFLFNAVEKFFASVGTTINISSDEAAFARRVLGVPQAKQRIVHNPTDPAFFVPATNKERLIAREKFGIPEDVPVLGSIGRLTDQKDPATLYRAFAKAARSHSSLLLLHIGEGPLQSEIKALSQELGVVGRIKRIPYQDEPRLFYSAINGLVMSSTYEAGWPIVILEAMSCGLSFVTTTAPGMSDIGSAGLSHCWTAPVGDAGGLASAMAHLVEDLETGRPCNHRTEIQRRFTPECCYGAVCDLYERALALNLEDTREPWPTE